jgi:hypothetical protein
MRKKYPRAKSCRVIYHYNMRIDEKSLQEFASIYEAEFNEKLDRQSVEEMASRVLVLYELLARRFSDYVNEESANVDEVDHLKIGFRT